MSKRISVEEHILQGSTNLGRALRYPPARPANACIAGRPAVPSDLTSAEKVVFKSTADLLEKRGCLTAGDADVLAAYARCAVALSAERSLLVTEGHVHVANKLDKHGNTILVHVINPRVRVVRDLESQLITLLKACGLTPSTRNRVQPAADPNEQLTGGERALRDAERILEN
jgi:P27 family predicted phage terminase small subunit